jgi:septal ring factor EnvC (AmiA/AmiB activator)
MGGTFIMDEQTAKRTRRTPEQKAEEIEAKIQKLTQEIETIEEKRATANQEFDQKIEAVKVKVAALEQRKKEILAPKPAKKPRKTKKQKIAEILKQAQKSGMKPEQIAEALGVTIED